MYYRLAGNFLRERGNEEDLKKAQAYLDKDSELLNIILNVKIKMKKVIILITLINREAFQINTYIIGNLFFAFHY